MVDYGKKIWYKLHCVNTRDQPNVRSVRAPPGLKHATIIVGGADMLVCNRFSEFSLNVVVG